MEQMKKKAHTRLKNLSHSCGITMTDLATVAILSLCKRHGDVLAYGHHIQLGAVDEIMGDYSGMVRHKLEISS